MKNTAHLFMQYERNGQCDDGESANDVSPGQDGQQPLGPMGQVGAPMAAGKTAQ